MTKKVRVALAGNPNAGKSTIFNALTGARQHVGNWPGKTVEKKSGSFKYDGYEVEVIDLPGAYSLSAYSPEEQIARDFIVQEKPDVVVNVVDASNLERNLYLTAQILETGTPVIVVLNMMDVAQTRGLPINVDKFSRLLGDLPVLPTIASKGVGLDALRQTIASFAERKDEAGQVFVTYEPDIEKEIDALAQAIAEVPTLNEAFLPRWLAVRLIEGEKDLAQMVKNTPGTERLQEILARSLEKLTEIYGEDVDVAIADGRYGFVRGLVRATQTRPPERRLTLSDKIDKVTTNKWLGIPIFLALMYLVFNLVQNVSAPYLDWVDGVISGPITQWTFQVFNAVGAPEWIVALATDGVIAGVGGVLVFVPGLLVMYFALAFLEDSGYLARAAFVMDRAMSALGMHGKSFIPMILSFGCNVPGIYATRTIESRSARILTGLLIPFMSCSARLPVYVIFGIAFFPAHSGSIIWGMYVIGIVVAVAVGWILSRTIFKDAEQGAFVMELPPYRMPTLKGLLIHMWEHTSGFVRKAGTIIMAVSIVLWFLLNMPWGVENPVDSYYGRISEAASPIFAPAGFDTWQATGSLITGFIAKEVVVSTMSQIYVGEEGEVEEVAPVSFATDVKDIVMGFVDATIAAGKELVEVLTPGITLFPAEEEADGQTALSQALQSAFTPLTALAFLLFVLLYVPCVATVAAQVQEFGWRWAILSVALNMGIAWIAAVLVYQGGHLLGWS
jgi:ferrous iron transport protein B